MTSGSIVSSEPYAAGLRRGKRAAPSVTTAQASPPPTGTAGKRTRVGSALLGTVGNLAWTGMAEDWLGVAGATTHSTPPASTSC